MEIKIGNMRLNPVPLFVGVLIGFLVMMTLLTTWRYQRLQDMTRQYCSPDAYCQLVCNATGECRTFYYGDPIVCVDGWYAGVETRMKWQQINYTGINGTLPLKGE